MVLNYIQNIENHYQYIYMNDFIMDYRKNNLFIENQEYKQFLYKYKFTPHYFDLKCRLNWDKSLIYQSNKMLEENKKDFNFYIRHLYVLYNLRKYYPFVSWFDYWHLGFIIKSKYNRSKYSIARTRQTLFDLCSCNFEKGHSLFLTLTYDINHKLDSTIYSTKGAFDYEQALIDIKRFCQRFKRVFGESMKYCYFIEQQNGKHNSYNFFTGAFHFHILIFNAIYFKQGFKNKDCKENAQKLWGHGIAYVEKVPQRNINNTCKYISKYISKDTLCVDCGSHALHSSKGLKRPLERKFLDLPYQLDNIISLELFDNLGMLSNGFNPCDLVPFIINDNEIIGNALNTPKNNKIVIHSRYIDITIMRLPSFDKNNNPIINEFSDILVKVHCDLDYRKNFFKKRGVINVCS